MEMRMAIPYAHQSISKDDIDAVLHVLQSDWLTQGPAIERFEHALAEYSGCQNAVVVCNATLGLHLACLALNLTPGDSLWTSPISFVASANCGLYCGARIDFVDIDPQTGNMSISALEEKLLSAEKSGTLPKIVVPVHFGGQSCEMARIWELSRQYHFEILEDASHAVGGSYQGKKVGSCAFSHMAVFSFHPVKIITTGEGGAILTNDADAAERLRRLRSHGITRDPKRMNRAPDGGWFYQQIELGYNARMTDLQAALGFSQLRRIDEFVARRHEIAQRYDRDLKSLPLIPYFQHPDAFSAYHLYSVRLDPARAKSTRRSLYDALHQAGIQVNVHYIPIHTQPFYQAMGFKNGDFPQAEAYYQEALSLPMYYGLQEGQQRSVISAIQNILRG